MLSYLFRRISGDQRRHPRCETWVRGLVTVPGAGLMIHGAVRNFSPYGCLFVPQDQPLFLNSNKLDLKVDELVIAAMLRRRSEFGLHMQFEKKQNLPWPSHCNRCKQVCPDRMRLQEQMD